MLYLTVARYNKLVTGDDVMRIQRVSAMLAGGEVSVTNVGEE